MKTRNRAACVKIQDLNQSNQVLREIASLQNELQIIDGQADQKIAKIKEQAALEGEKKRKRIIELEQGLSVYAEYNKADLFPEKRSVDLPYGRIGFHRSTKIHIKHKPENKSTLALLKKLFKGQAIRIKEEVDKDELNAWPSEKLAQINATKDQNDNFYYEIDRDEVNQSMLAVH